ncbi:hypothetical protein JHK85_040885 [Glycine max]|nr:hypothetical protein JHK86_040300 [Glycine max]KAG4965910.1 hypothetical protein JHK85_040885 [Glycine max]
MGDSLNGSKEPGEMLSGDNPTKGIFLLPIINSATNGATHELAKVSFSALLKHDSSKKIAQHANSGHHNKLKNFKATCSRKFNNNHMV